MSLTQIHGDIRWLILLVGVIALVKFIIGFVQKQEYTQLDRRLMLAYTIVIDINVLLGLINLFLLGVFARPQLEHAFTMILALIAVHVSARWRKSEDSAKIFRNNIIVILISIALIFVGVLALRGSWVF